MAQFSEKDSSETAPALLIQQTNDIGWTDCMGFPQSRPEIKKILCLKFDHIGDILVADFSFRLLRKYFPDANITLICGEWNVELAEELGLADTVIGVSLFHPQGGEQHNEKVALAARNAGITRLMQVALSQPEFDLAIDMRIADDTRELLKFFKSKVYVGSGDLTKHSFLDISVAQSETHLNQAPSKFRLMPRDFISGSGYEIKSFGVGFTSAVLSFPIKLEIDGAMSPAACGIRLDDHRLLGVGIESISVVCEHPSGESTVLREFTFERGSADCQFLSQGWASPESWGTWSVESEATIVLSCRDNELLGNRSLLLRFHAHTNEHSRRVAVKACDLTSDSAASVSCEFPMTRGQLSLPVAGNRRFGLAKTRPVHLRAGKHAIHVETFNVDTSSPASLKLTILGTRPDRAIKSYELIATEHSPARDNFVFEFDHRDSDEAIQLQLEAGSSGKPFGLYVVALSSSVIQAASANVPASHMEKLIARVVMAAALEFSAAFSDLYLVPEDRFKLVNDSSLESRDQLLIGYVNQISDKKRDFKIVGLGIGTTKETKRWPFGYILELCERLLSRSDVYLVLVGGPSDVDDTLVLEQALRRPLRVLNFCGKTKLAAFGAVIAPMDLYIGYDTGTTHYAGKVGIRTIGIFAAVHSPREWGPVGRKASWITRYTDCSPCYLAKLDECRYGHACMLELLPSECWKTISAALDGSLARSDQTVVLIDNVGTVAGVEVDGHAFLKDIGSARSEKQGDEELSNAAVAPSCLDQQTLYRVGHTYRAGIDPEFSSAFVNGWFGLEACGIWSGPQAHARFAYTLNQSESVQLEIQCLGHFDEDAKSIYVSSGGEEQIISFRSKAWETKIIDINPKVFGDVCTVDMVFKCPDATSPASTGHNREDARVLGLMIASFALRPRSSRELT